MRPYIPPDHGVTGPSRVERILARVSALSPQEIDSTLAAVYEAFAGRRARFDDVLMDGFAVVEPWVADTKEMNLATQRLIGAYFLHEYSVEAAALTNPSIVAHPNQDGLTEGAMRIVISLRAVGEGHISSIEFRSGQVSADGDISVDTPAELIQGTRATPLFDKTVFSNKLEELGADTSLIENSLGELQEQFTMAELNVVLSTLESYSPRSPITAQMIHTIHWLASSNYQIVYTNGEDLSQRILTPSGPAESRGMEDARFVRFTETDGSIIYYGTYTAYDGFNILPQLIETLDFQTFRISTLNGTSAVNKGIALFPRRIGGRYAALGRSDGESNFLMMSDHVRFWNDADRIQVPVRPWELLQIGNAGTPIETEAGWLVVTHGVGPMRQYALGAILLDLDDPSQVIGHLREPLLVPTENERDGYVPNVVYSCGSLIHGSRLVIAYGMSDTATGFATVPIDILLSALTAT